MTRNEQLKRISELKTQVAAAQKRARDSYAQLVAMTKEVMAIREQKQELEAKHKLIAELQAKKKATEIRAQEIIAAQFGIFP